MNMYCRPDAYTNIGVGSCSTWGGGGGGGGGGG